MSKKDVQFNIRMTKELKERIDEEAKANNRTANAEATTLLIEALDARKKLSPLTENKTENGELLTNEHIRKLIEEEVFRKIEKVINHGMKPTQK
ncbi:Arc-like DNA binding domain [Providencia rettgeri]|nr:Arc-like DNA binding domain [Providencia rettgeri]